MTKFPAKNHSTPKARSGGGTLLGIIIGLVLGLILAVAVAFYLNKGPRPFANNTGSVPGKAAAKGAADSSDPNKPLYGKDAKSGTAPKAGAPGEEKRFSFYEILPGKEEVMDPRKAQDSARAETKSAGDAKDTKAGAADAKSGAEAAKEQYFLQVGAFAAAGDADNQKAKLALMGFEARVETVDIEGKGAMHRVRLGPYGRLDDINRVRATLASNGVDAALIRIKDAQK